MNDYYTLVCTLCIFQPRACIRNVDLQIAGEEKLPPLPAATSPRGARWPFDLDVFDMYDKNLITRIIIIYHY